MAPLFCNCVVQRHKLQPLVYTGVSCVTRSCTGTARKCDSRSSVRCARCCLRQQLCPGMASLCWDWSPWTSWALLPLQSQGERGLPCPCAVSEGARYPSNTRLCWPHAKGRLGPGNTRRSHVQGSTAAAARDQPVLQKLSGRSFNVFSSWGS